MAGFAGECPWSGAYCLVILCLVLLAVAWCDARPALAVLAALAVLTTVLIKLKRRECVYGMSKNTDEVKGGRDDRTTKNAFVMLLFNGDAYLPGVLTLAHSLREHGNTSDIVCMVTPDVPESATEAMRVVGVKVRRVDYIKFLTKRMKSKKQQERYSKWANVSFTKWQCLALTQYEKILFLDADMLARANIEDVFDVQAPAGVFETPWGTQNPYVIDRGSPVPDDVTPAQIKKALETWSYVNTGTCVLLEPSAEHLAAYTAMVKAMQPFGLNSTSGMDEQSLAYFYSVYKRGPRVGWKNLGYSYAYMMWKYKALKQVVDVPIKIIDYFGRDKPWDIKEGVWPDMTYWHEAWRSLVQKYPQLTGTKS